MLEAIADQQLWFWHAYFGVPGAINDLNVLYGSPLFDDLLMDKAPEASFVVNGKTYVKGYYLADGIYPQWSMFVKAFTIARDQKIMKFKRVQESEKKILKELSESYKSFYQRCDDFYWIDGELYGDWHKTPLYEMYVSMNPNQRYLFEHEVNQHEREIKSQQRIAALEEELEANSNMVDELKRAKSDVDHWRKISTFPVFVLCVMFMLLLVVL
nr:hypothetical protein [Tanacetum cinerariifolium]